MLYQFSKKKYFPLPQQLENGSEHAQSIQGNGKIEFRVFSLQRLEVRMVFVLKLHGCYVPGLESFQTSILR